jgi:hypothetical protein
VLATRLRSSRARGHPYRAQASEGVPGDGGKAGGLTPFAGTRASGPRHCHPYEADYSQHLRGGRVVAPAAWSGSPWFAFRTQTRPRRGSRHRGRCFSGFSRGGNSPSPWSRCPHHRLVSVVSGPPAYDSARRRTCPTDFLPGFSRELFCGATTFVSTPRRVGVASPVCNGSVGR